MRSLLMAAALACAAVSLLPGASIVLDLASDLINESNDKTGANVAITPEPVWKAAAPGASWISYTNTGIGSGSLWPENSATANDVTAIFFESFFLPYSRNAGSLRVWADDTTRVLLNGHALIEPAFTLDAHCAQAAIGCETNEGAALDLSPYLLQGGNTLTFETYQLGGGPFGLLYSGSVQSRDPEIQRIPEPGAWLLFGAGLVVIGLFRRRAE